MSFGATHQVGESSHSTPVAHLLTSSDEQQETLTERHEAQKTWRTIELILANAREQRIAYLLFHCGLSPNEIVHHCPQEFTNLQEVLHLRCNVIKKLMRFLVVFP